MSFGMLSFVDPENHVLDEGVDTPRGRGTFRGVYGLLQNKGFLMFGKRKSCAKLVGPILMIYTSYDVSLRKEVSVAPHLRGIISETYIFGSCIFKPCKLVQHESWRHLSNTIEPSTCGGDAAFCQNTLTTCYVICNKLFFVVIGL